MGYSRTHLTRGVYYESLEIINGVRFTCREIDIIACLLSGKSTKTVARFLSIEEKTVDTHKYNIMRKVDCNAKEGIIHFIEKSDRFPVIKKHYLGLLLQSAFEESLGKVAALVEKKKLHCFLIYWRKMENTSLFVDWLKKYLSLAGIEILEKTQESFDSLDKFIHKVESSCILYILPPAFTDLSLKKSSTINSELLLFIQKQSQDPYSIIFLLINNSGPLPLEITDCADFSGDNHYFPLLDLLEKVVVPSGLSLGTIIAEFKQQYTTIYEPSGKYFPQLEPIEKEIAEASFKNSHIFFEILKKYKAGLLITLGIGCSLYFISQFRNSLFSFHQLSHATTAFSARSELPIPHSDIILKRPSLILGIDEKFKKGGKDIKVLALIGPGGSGKTVVAHQYGRLQEGVVWEVNATTDRSIRESFEKLAYLLSTTEEEKKVLIGLREIQKPQEKEEKILLFIKERLRSIPRWLLIFDNVGEFSDIKRYVPSDPAIWGKGRVIITTQNGNLEAYNAVHYAVPVNELNAEEKLSLFLNILHNGDIGKLAISEQKKVEEFLKELPPFPLDVSVAAYYLKATSTSYAEYIRNIGEYNSEFDSVQGYILNEAGAYSKTRYKIITLSLEKMMKGSKDFGEILLFISFMNVHNIPRELLDLFKDPIVIDGFIHHLKKYSLATHGVLPENSLISCLTVHGSTQNIALSYLSQKLGIGKDSLLLKDISRALDRYMDKALEKEDFLRMNLSASHAETFISHRELLPNFIKGVIKSKLGCLYYFLNDHAKAQKTIHASLPVLDTQLLKSNGETDMEIAQAFLHIGNIYTELSNYKEAKNILSKSLLIYNKTLPKDYLKISWGLSHLANAYRRSGYYTKAKGLLEESLALQTQYSSHDQSRIARTLAYLGSVYRGIGHYEKSISILHKSLNLYQQYFPKDHFRVGWVLCHLGNVYRSQGDYKKSIETLEEGLKIYKKNFSDNHINVGLMLTYLGNSYKSLGDYEKARKLLEEGLKVHEEHFKKDHERIGRILYLLGTVYRDLDDPKKSRSLFKNALAIYEKSLAKGSQQGKGELEMARLYRNMGSIHLLEDRLEEAESKIQTSLEILKRHHHPEIYLSLESMSELLVKKAMKTENSGQAKEFKNQAVTQLWQALEVMIRHFPNDSAHIQKVRNKIKEIKESINATQNKITKIMS